jgi:hypothetical protein
MDSDSGIDIDFKEHQPDETSLVCADIIKITYDLGIQIFGKCLVAARDGTDEKLIPTLLLRDICIKVMATAILARNGFSEPCDLTVRALYESCVSLMYMLDGDTAKKAASYRVVDAIEWNKLAKKMSPFTDEGKDLRRRLQDDRLGKLDYPIFQNDPNVTSGLEEMLNELRRDPVNEVVFQEYERIMDMQRKRKGRRVHPWYQLFGGPQSIKGLANNTRMLYYYETFYNLASKTAHGINALRFDVIFRKDGTFAIPIISSQNIDIVARSVVYFAMITFREMIERFCLDMVPAYREWLVEVQRQMTKIGIASSTTTNGE